MRLCELNFTPTLENCPVVLVKLLSNTAVKRHLTMLMKLEGKKSLQFHANKQQYDMNLGLLHKSFELSLPLKIIFTAPKSLYSCF